MDFAPTGARVRTIRLRRRRYARLLHLRFPIQPGSFTVRSDVTIVVGGGNQIAITFLTEKVSTLAPTPK